MSTPQVKTLVDYIKKYDLQPWRQYPSNPPSLFGAWIANLYVKRSDEDRWEDDRFEILANADKTRFVSINKTRQLFRIIHHELAVIKSDWEDVNTTFMLEDP